jgi:hypothetical protein
MIRFGLSTAVALWLVAACGVPAVGSPSSPPDSLGRITSKRQFDRMAREDPTSARSRMPHVLFVVDRADHDRVYYVHSRRFRFHRDFLNAKYLSLERGDGFFTKNYSNPLRRFVCGTLSYQAQLQLWTFQFFEGDLIEADLLQLVARRLAATFFAPVTLLANSEQQYAAGQAAGLQPARPAELFPDHVFQALNVGEACGQLRLLDHAGPETVVDRNEIVLLREVPIRLNPVAGVIHLQAPSPLSHLNVLARSWGIPNVYAAGADEVHRQLIGRYVRLVVRPGGYDLRLADPAEVADSQRRAIEHTEAMTPSVDLEFERLAQLGELRRHDSVRVGAKAANLGELMAARIPSILVPNGFAIPFSWYARFVRENGIEVEYLEMLDDQRFNHDPAYRRQRLAALRQRIIEAPIRERDASAIAARRREVCGDAGVFVRSSTSAEDLPGFPGAGLYTSVPNVVGDEALLTAVRTVWASIWNDVAFEARAAAGVSHLQYPGVLIQLGMNADSAGVLVTTNPFNQSERGAVYLNAKKGLGIRVVDGFRVAEQVLVSASGAVRVLTRSADDTALAFDAAGGVREVRVEPDRNVLTDRLASRLATAGRRIHRAFAVGPLDIEWLVMGQQIYIVQVRPYPAG